MRISRDAHDIPPRVRHFSAFHVETVLDEQCTPLLIIAHPLRPNVTVKLVHYGARVSEPDLS